MKLCLTLMLGALLGSSNATPLLFARGIQKASARQDFEHPVAQGEQQCGLPSCPNYLPGPSESLTWKGFSTTYAQTTGSGNPAFQTAYSGYFYGLLNGTTKSPSSASIRYPGSKVIGVDFNGLALGCSAKTNVTNPPGAPPGTYTNYSSVDCILRVNGWNNFTKTGAPLGKANHTRDIQFKATESRNNPQGLPFWPMRAFYDFTGYGKVVYLTFELFPVKGAKYFDLQGTVDALQYTTYNTTSN